MSKPHPFHEFPKHLYHATKLPVIAYDKETEAKARAEDYGDTYIPQGVEPKPEEKPTA